MYYYQPKTLDDIENYQNIKELLDQWYKTGMKKPLLFYGKPGIGKTVMARCFARSYGFSPYEINASSEKIIKPSEKRDIFGRKILVIIDELESVSDKKTVKELMEKFPCILIANDPYVSKLKDIREKCHLVEFKGLHPTQILKLLRRIAKLYNIEVDDETLKEIIKKNEKDVRASINDLFSLSVGKNKVEKHELEVLGYRDKEAELFLFLAGMFKSKEYYKIVLHLYNLDVDHDILKAWIDENIPIEYEKIDDIYRAYEMLSKADIFDGRIKRRQYYGLLKYSSVLMTYGVAAAKKEKYKKFTRYRFPSFLFKRRKKNENN